MGEANIKLEIVGQLLALLAHDLRNPLSALHSNVGFLVSVLKEQDEDVADALSDGLVSCDGLSHIIDNIDLFGQALRQSHPPSRGTFGLWSLLKEVVLRCEQVAKSHGVEIETDWSELEPECEVMASRDLLAKSLGNLIRNCIQHSPPRSAVRLRARSGVDRVEISILDAGVPLSKDLWGIIFTAEGQVTAKASSDGRYSRGMGLFAAQLAADASGASVQVAEPPPGYSNALQLVVERATP